MERCVRSARAAGVFKPFHVLTDRQLEGCECYDSLGCDKAHGLFKLHLLKAAAARLPYDYLIWLDADTLFVRNPLDVLAPLRASPIHVPLELNLSTQRDDRLWKGVPCSRLRQLLERAGLANQVYLCRSAFWIVHREAIDDVFEQAFTFWNFARNDGLTLEVDLALGFVMQIYCADPEAHLVSVHPEVWASDDLGQAAHEPGEDRTWLRRHPVADEGVRVNPAIVHTPTCRALGPTSTNLPINAQSGDGTADGSGRACQDWPITVATERREED
jgi:hypothetical protein